MKPKAVFTVTPITDPSPDIEDGFEMEIKNDLLPTNPGCSSIKWESLVVVTVRLQCPCCDTWLCGVLEQREGSGRGSSKRRQTRRR